jgi:voltage-gated potassium channel
MKFDNESLRIKLHEIIFEADTKAGKLFDEILLGFILLSIITVMLETIPNISPRLVTIYHVLEWIFTIIFTIEYFTRIYIVKKPINYITSFYGIIDLLAILPTYLSLVFAGTQSLIIIRAIRLLRVFRIFKMVSYLHQGKVILVALRSSAIKIAVFLLFVLILVSIFGSVMYLVEGSSNEKFDSIPRSVYWAIVTITTVGYGDISPTTVLGQFLSSLLMLLGYAIIAVPTGIVTGEMLIRRKTISNTQTCRNCSKDDHDDNAVFCKHCGEELHPEKNQE